MMVAMMMEIAEVNFELYKYNISLYVLVTRWFCATALHLSLCQ